MLTITWVSRNDDHGRNLIGRIQAALDALEEYHLTLGMDIELIFVEWNPPSDTPRLRETLRIPDFPLRWIEVPAELHQMFGYSDRIPLYQHIGANVGMRRAQGDWVLTTTHDIVFSEKIARLIASEQFAENCFYRTGRLDGYTYFGKPLPVAERISQIEQMCVRLKDYNGEGLFTKASGDFILMSRNKWHILEGYTEWHINGMYFDGLFLHRAAVLGMTQAILEGNIYHMEHASGGEARLRGVGKNIPHMSHNLYRRICAKMYRKNKPIYIHESPWGLGDWEMEEIGDNAWKLVNGNPPKTPYQYGKWRGT